MDAREAIKQIMKKKGLSNAEMARLLDVTQATVWDRLNNKKGRKDISISLLAEMLAPLGYEISLIPKGTDLPSNSYSVGVVE